MPRPNQTVHAIGHNTHLPATPQGVNIAGNLPESAGLNMLNQAREFNETVGLTGIVLTKLDGTARGGAVVSVVSAVDIA